MQAISTKDCFLRWANMVLECLNACIIWFNVGKKEIFKNGEITHSPFGLNNYSLSIWHINKENGCMYSCYLDFFFLQISSAACGYGFTLLASNTKDVTKVWGMGLNKDSQLGFQRTQHDRRKWLSLHHSWALSVPTLSVSECGFFLFFWMKPFSNRWLKHMLEQLSEIGRKCLVSQMRNKSDNKGLLFLLSY